MAKMNWDKVNKQKKAGFYEPIAVKGKGPQKRKKRSPQITQAGPVKITKADGTVVWQEPLKGPVANVKQSGKKVRKNTSGMATDKQIKFMRSLGIPVVDGLTIKQASALISEALKNKSKEETDDRIS